MSCASFRSALQDVALGQAATPQLGAHLSSCEPCRRQVEADRRLAGRIDGEIEEMLAIEASPGLGARLRAQVAETETAPSTTLRWGLPATLAASVLVLAVLLSDPAPRSASPPAPPSATATAVSENPGGERATSTPAAPPVAPEEGPPVGKRVALTPRPAAPRRVAPEVLIPPGEREATRRFVEGRQRWRVWGETSAAQIQLLLEPVASELETLETPAVVDWQLEARQAQRVEVRVLDSWPLMPGP